MAYKIGQERIHPNKGNEMLVTTLVERAKQTNKNVLGKTVLFSVAALLAHEWTTVYAG